MYLVLFPTKYTVQGIQKEVRDNSYFSTEVRKYLPQRNTWNDTLNIHVFEDWVISSDDKPEIIYV